MRNKYKNCTALTTGIISDLKIKGQDFPTVITVQYVVDMKSYSISDTIKLKSEKVKVGFLTVGQKRVAALGETSVGSEVRVQYDPDNPGIAFLPDNEGKANV